MSLYYANELEALKRSGRYRSRSIDSGDVVDLASNDYLGLAHNAALRSLTCNDLAAYEIHAPKASMLVNGYHDIHRNFEAALCAANGFEAGVVLGSGFSANIAMIEALVRKGDALFIDASYHASGQLAARLVEGEVIVFAHNDPEDLRTKLFTCKAKRRIIAVEGIYSMEGDVCARAIFDLADECDALLIVDEAHSSGVIGPNLMGIFDHYAIAPRYNHIKMGTLGKAYGSFGAYILASEHIIDFLINRAKPIIYATAPSLFDTLLGHHALVYIQTHTPLLAAQIALNQALIKACLGLTCKGLIVPIAIGDNRRVLEIQAHLREAGYAVGAIRQPTVERAIIRLIARLGVPHERLSDALGHLAKLL
ncbi:MAG: pyridoxal phosphate-dependent aminotransferase family protein [Campylobacterales bacterium]|nr:pyridoxal phosphate-dependent aminotransferase family protein [Campylobacterales bacterium]